MADMGLLLLESFFENDSAFEDDEMGFDELDCSDPLAMSGKCDLHKGIQINVTEHPHSLRKVANIVITLQRFQKVQHVQSTEFTDHELFNIIMENVVEESVVMRVNSSPKSYNKLEKVLECTVCDSLKKSLVHKEGDPYLLAVTLRNINISQSVSLTLSAYTTPTITATSGQPVCLRIAKTNLYLACTKASGTHQLIVEEVNDEETLKTIYEKDDMERFLFLRKVEGDSVNTFQSVKFPGWFISTSKKEYMPVDMCEVQDASRTTVFSLLNQKEI